MDISRCLNPEVYERLIRQSTDVGYQSQEFQSCFILWYARVVPVLPLLSLKYRVGLSTWNKVSSSFSFEFQLQEFPFFLSDAIGVNLGSWLAYDAFSRIIISIVHDIVHQAIHDFIQDLRCVPGQDPFD